MNTKHTPGPWTAEKVPSTLPVNNHWEIAADSPHMRGLRQTVCSINGPHDPANYAANAALIAAAPELLAALATLLRETWDADRIYGDDHRESMCSNSTWANARAAIAKATGCAQPNGPAAQAVKFPGLLS